MAASGVLVSCSGAVLSSLLYEQLRSGHAQEGFLLGQVQSHISEHISDSQICNEKMETVINLSSFLPCTMIGTFYSGAGALNNEKLTNYLGSNLQRVIGWYRCRGSNCEDLYLRETMVHQQLSAVMTHTGGHFIVGIMSSHPSGDSGTFTVNHKFMMLQNKRLEGVPLQVVNIGDTSTTDYLLKPQNPALYSSNAVQTVLSKINGEPGVLEAETLHTGLLKKLEILLPEFSSAQEDLEKVLKEVVQLRELCNAHNIKPDFTPEAFQAVEAQDLMDFDEISGSPVNILQATKGCKQVNTKSPLPRKGSGRGRDIKEEKSTSESSDPFGFVNTEMEKLQVKTRGSPSGRGSRSRTNTPSPGRILTKSKSALNTLQRTPPRRCSESAGSNDGSPVPANKRHKENSSLASASSDMKITSEEGVGKGKPKPNRAITRTASKESNSPARTTRGRSPSVTSSVGSKPGRPKVRKAWSEKSASDSQDF
ncbi:BRCA1-A complex subunit Abraxas 1-like isoform X2 [Homarus americanus]|uniref:BRCA1-A complex subunit Abraxas 1-like isoform X2 n=1 Tax=Homarus americanus TaxID=6706 RepID=UPI001C477386|nr:BRCA1-A complex subunit Abraxas 1-like isoform X2 [Homarus americanus]